MRFRDRPIAITDIETTGLDASLHEIIDIAVVVVDPRTLNIQDQYHSRVRPMRASSAPSKALEVSGYTPAAWRNAVSLETAMAVYADKARDAVFCSYSTFLSYSFIDAAFKSTGIEDPTDYHRLDLFTLAWSRLNLSSPTMDQICRKLQLEPEPKPHRAMAGAMLQLHVLRALLYR